MLQPHLEISPKALRFRAETKKQPPTILTLTNATQERIAFKVKTTAPRKYCVKPSADVIGPNSSMEVKVFLQGTKDTSAASGECRDKFLVQSTPVPAGYQLKGDESNAAEVFSKKDNPQLYEEKLRVIMASPAPPSPVPEDPQGDTQMLDAASKPLAEHTARMADRSGTTGEGGTASAAAGAGGGSSGDLAAENRKLREQLAMLELKSTEAAVKVGGSSESSASQIKLLHLIIVAIVAYILGMYLA